MSFFASFLVEIPVTKGRTVSLVILLRVVVVPVLGDTLGIKRIVNLDKVLSVSSL